MENSIKNLNDLAKEFDLSDFYAVSLWGVDGELNLQGYFTDKNLSIVEALDIKLSVEGSFLRGKTDTEHGTVKIVLTTSN